MEASAGRVQVREIHQRKVVTVALVTIDAFIVVQEITAAIENEAVSIDFDRSRMMRRMPVNDRHAGLVDDGPGQNFLLMGMRYPQLDPQWIETTTRSPGLLSAMTWSATSDALASERSGSKLTPGASGVAAHSSGMPLDVDPNEKIRSRALARFSTAGARASRSLRPAPVALTLSFCRTASVSSRPARPQSSTWLLANTQQSIPAAARILHSRGSCGS